MKKINTDIRDIYRAKNSLPEPSAPQSLQKSIEQEIHKRRVFNLCAGSLSVVLVSFLTIAFVTDYLPATQKPDSPVKPPAYITARDLAEDEQWALEYQQAASQADSSEPAGAKGLTSKWVKNAAYHMIMGEQAVRQNDLPSAQAHFERTLATFPEITGVHRPLGVVYLKQQYFGPAAEQLEQALKEHSSIDVLNNLGAAYIGAGQNDRAEEVLKQAVRQNPDLAGCYKNLALLYRRSGRTNEAAAAFENYFARAPQDTRSLEAYAAYLTSAGRSRDVIAFLERIEGADPLAVRMMLARTFALNNDIDRAVCALREISGMLTPRQVIAVMHEAAFEKISRSGPFEKLMYEMELAAVSSAPRAKPAGRTP